jgi:hypothetical protein
MRTQRRKKLGKVDVLRAIDAMMMAEWLRDLFFRDQENWPDFMKTVLARVYFVAKSYAKRAYALLDDADAIKIFGCRH